MKAALASEFRKFFSTRMWWILLACMVGYMVFLAATMALAFHFAPSDVPGASSAAPGNGPSALEMARMIYTVAPSIGYVFPALVGAMAITTEYRYQTLTPTFLAEPRRLVVLGAKLIAAVPMGLAFAVAGELACVGPGAAIFALTGEPTGLDSAGTWEIIGRGAVALTLWTILGVGFGALLHNQVASIVVLLAFTQLVEPLLRTIPMMLGMTWGFTDYLPGAASDAVVGASFYAALGSVGSGGGALINPWAAIAILVTYGLVFAGAGYLTSFRRDIT